MAKYVILGQEITFSEEEDLYCFFQTGARMSEERAICIFVEWYRECGNIETVLDNYADKSVELVYKGSTEILYSQLTELGIYDVSENEFIETCVDLTYLQEADKAVSDIYDDIIRQQEMEHEYREERKSSRGRVVGGGFGLSGALKGMVSAGLMNAATGALHSIGNGIGNVNSDMEAEELKKALYQDEDTVRILVNGIWKNIELHFHIFMDFLNERFDGCINVDFNQEKSETLFRNAVNIPEKRNVLLAAAFKRFPWNRNLYEYIYENFPTERENIVAIGEMYGINLDNEIDEVTEEVNITEEQGTLK